MKNRAFTIVELMVVVAIIGILSAIGILSYSGQQKKAREARRISDVGAISDAIQQYVSMGHDVPTTGGAWGTTNPGGPLDVLATEGLLARVPTEPYPQGSTTNCTTYLYTAAATGLAARIGPDGVVGTRQYALGFHSEVATAKSQFHAMNNSIVTLDSFIPVSDCNYYIAFLLGPK